MNAKDNYGDTALTVASMNGHTDLVKLLLGHENIDVNVENNSGATAFKWASGHDDIAKLLSDYMEKTN